jgi:single-stranded-DNA-specific exonuclease
MIWQVFPKITDEFSAANPGYGAVLLQLLANRGLENSEEIKDFFQADLTLEEVGQKYDPFLFRDMATAVDLIISHLKSGHKIMIYGDYDADGVTATVVLYETLKLLKAEVGFYLPDRVSEGYGMNQTALEHIIADGYKLIITVDTGIRNKPEIDLALTLGAEVIVTDHHTLPEDKADCPNCLVIDPSDRTDGYPFYYLAGVGVAYKLAEALISKSTLSESQKSLILERNLDLVAIGTVADLVKLLGENRLLVQRGLKVLNKTKRLGLQELIKTAQSNGKNNSDNVVKLDSWNIGYQIGPRLNAASRIDHANTALELLISQDEDEAIKISQDLNNKNNERQRITEEIAAQVDKKIDKNNLPYIIIGLCELNEEAWNEGVIGLVAGRLAEKYYRPTLVITKTAEGFKSSGRSIAELNLIAGLEEAQENLDKFGGHPMACGFSVYSQEKLDKFIAQITAYATKNLIGQELIPKLKLDCELDLNSVGLDLIAEINKLAPYGQNNPQPKFVSYGVRINDIMKMGKENQHIKLKLGNLWAIAFSKGEEYGNLEIGSKIDVAYYLEINDFNGRVVPQLKIIDIVQ